MLVGTAMYATANDRFYINDFTIAAGETRTVSILLDNETEYTAFQCDLQLPEGLNVDEESFALTERKHSNHTLSVSLFPDRTFRLMSYSLKLKTYSGNSGALVTFDITADDDFTSPVTITIHNTVFTTEEGVEVSFDDEECQAYLRGDVNMDGNVNVGDVTALIRFVLSHDAPGINLVAADVNEDGNINIGDVTALIRLVLGK